MKRSARLKIAIVGALLLLAVAASPGSAVTAAGDTVRIELRVWQDVQDDRGISVSARPADGSWQTLGVIPLPLDDGHGPYGVYRYGDITVAVSLRDRATPLNVDMRVWQHVKNGRGIYISARASGDSWATLGTIPLLLDDGVSSLLGLRYGDIGIDAPLPEEEVSTLAGRAGVRGYEDGPGDAALFGRYADSLGLGVEVDRDGNVIVADRENRAIRRIAPDGTVTTIAGGNGPGLRDGPAATAQFEGPTDVAIAHDGAIYVADSPAHRIRKITPDGMVTTVAGGGPTARSRSSEGTWGSFRDGPADKARFAYPHRIAFGPYGDLFIIEWNKRIRRLSPSGTVVTFAGTGTPGYEDGPRQQAEFFNLLAIDVDLAGNVYVIDNSPTIKTGLVPTIRKIDTAGVVSTLYRDVPLTRGGTLATPIGLAVARDGAIYIANTGRHQIVELTRDGELRAVAGTGEQGYIDGPRDQAMFSLPGAIAVSDDGTLVVADEGNNVIRTIDLSAGVLSSHALALAGAEQIPRLQGVEVTIFAGRPGPKFAGVPRFMDGPAESTLFYRPWGMALDAEGNVIVADSGNDAIRRIAPDGTVTTVAGGSGRGLLDAPGADAQFSQPKGVAVHPDGSIYVADSGNNRIRRIAPDGSVTTVAGSGPPAIEGNRGDFRNGPASEARFRDPSALAFDEAGNLLISDTENNRIRSLSPDGEVSTVAGGSPPPAPDSGVGNPGSRDGPGPHAYVGLPGGIAVDDEGNIFFTESNNAIRMIDGSGYVSTVLRTPHSRHGGALSPFIDGIAVGNDGALYVADAHYPTYARVVRITREGALSIVSDSEFTSPQGIVATPDGGFLVSDPAANVIWKITVRSVQ